MPALRITANPAVTSPQDLTVIDFPNFQALFEAVQKASGPGEKEDSDLLVPVAEWSKAYRADENAVTMARVFCCDFDRLPDETMDEIMAKLEGLSVIVYSTHSHRQPKKDGLNCYRVLVELDREYPAQGYAVVWDALNRLLGHLDPATRRRTLGYYLPGYPPGAGALAECFFLEGSPFQVPEAAFTCPLLSAQATTHTRTTPQGPAPSLGALESVLASWARQAKDIERRATAMAARELLKGRNTIPLHEGRRNAFLTSLAGYLAAQFPDVAGVAHLFQGLGWDHFAKDGKYSLDDLDAMIFRFQAKEQEAKEAARAEEESKRSRIIASATGGARTTLITPEEVAHIETVFGPGWQNHVIAAKAHDLWLLRPDGTYDPDPVNRDLLFVAARDRLCVFGDYVEYTYEDEAGTEKRKTPQVFLEEYAKKVRSVVYDMSKPRGGYDAITETVFLPAAAPVVAAVGHEDVHEWLESMGDYLIDMLAVMPKLGRMAPALVLTGPRDCGKTLLALGVGQVYGRAPADAEAAFSTFNAGVLTKQPIVFMDEKVADAYQREGTTLIRKFVSQGVRQLDEKYQSRVDLIGYPRLIIAANNTDVLNTSQEMSLEDREAFAERLVHVDMGLGKATLDRYRPRIQERWLDGRALAEHVLYLSENWEIRHPGSRFAVASNHTRLHEGLASRAGSAGDVACWLLNFVSSPEKGKHLPATFTEGTLRVNTAALIQGWQTYLRDHRPPSPSQISRALKSLSKKSRQKITIVEGGTTKRVDAYEIDPRLLRSENEVHGLVSDFESVFNLTDHDKKG